MSSNRCVIMTESNSENISFHQPNQKIILSDPEKLLGYAACHGLDRLVVRALQKGATNYNIALAYAACNDNLEMMRLMMQRGATDYEAALPMAATRGSYNAAKFLLEVGNIPVKPGENNIFNISLYRAANGGHFRIVELMVQAGATNYSKAIRYAYRYRRQDIAEMIQEWATTKEKLQ